MPTVKVAKRWTVIESSFSPSCLPLPTVPLNLVIFLALISSSLHQCLLAPLSLPYSFQSQLQSTIPAAEERSTIKTITMTLILTGLTDKATDHSYTAHDSYLYSRCYITLVMDGTVLSVGPSGGCTHVVVVVFHCVKISVWSIRSGCQVSPSSWWHVTVHVMPVSADEHSCVTMCAAVAFRDHKVPLSLFCPTLVYQCSVQERWKPWAATLTLSFWFKGN